LEKLRILLAKEFTLELRQTSVIWGALFWITILFTIINTVAKSFIGGRKGKDIYYYSIVSPQLIILSKIIYNFLLGTILSSAGFILFALFLNNPVANLSLFFLLIILTSWGFAASLTLLSGIAAKADNSNILMAVLSFPVVISILLTAVKVTKNILDGIDPTFSMDELASLLAINCLVTAASYLLFPYLWRN